MCRSGNSQNRIIPVRAGNLRLFAIISCNFFCQEYLYPTFQGLKIIQLNFLGISRMRNAEFYSKCQNGILDLFSEILIMYLTISSKNYEYQLMNFRPTVFSRFFLPNSRSWVGKYPK